MTLTIGLFGTCGGSTWRVPFKKKYDELGIEYFDPQVDDWNEEFAKIEAQHMAEDAVLLVPITGQTYSLGSLSEIGFHILQVARLESRHDIVVFVEQKLDAKLDNEALRSESLRMRTLAAAHLKQQRLENLYVVDSLEQMLELSLKAYENARIRESIAGYNPHRKV